MKHYVYIIHSESLDIFYKGYTTDPSRRLNDHNLGKSRFTKNKGPWKMAYLKEYGTKTEALIEELRIKRLKRASIEKLIGV